MSACQSITRLASLFACAVLLAACNDSSPSSSPSNAMASAASTTATTVTLSGTPPAQVVVGAAYSFQPQASTQTAGLRYSVMGKPAWLTFNADTGALSGTPAAANVGTYSGISILAYGPAGSAAQASIGPFAISVVSSPATATTNSAHLKWVAPTQNTDGTPLTDLAGYTVYWGTDPNNLTSTAKLTDATATSYAVTGLTSGTWYFALSTYTSAGTDSALSNIGSKTIG